ncbi:outer membrane beta-barrel protein [Thermodesulfobacteriota bacterium]
MTRRKYGFVNISLWVLLLIPLFLTTQVFAQGNIRLGRLAVRGSLAYKIEFNDNIYSEATDEVDDIIHIITPEILFNYEGTPGNFLNFGYKGDFAIYSDYSDNNYQTHRPFIDGGYKSPYGLYLLAGNYFMATSDPYGSLNQFRVGVPQTKRWDNTLYGTLGYEFAEKYAVEGTYKYYVLRYDRDVDVWQDRTDNVYGGTLLYGITPKTALLAEFRRTDGEYVKQNDGAIDLASSVITGTPVFWSSDTSQDYTLDDVYIGARFKPGGKISGQIKIGYQKKRFDNVRDVNGNLYQDQSTWAAETSVGYQLYSRTRFNFTLYRSILGSPDLIASSYYDTQLGLDVSHGFRDNLILYLGYFWGNNDYQDEVAGFPEKDFHLNDVRVKFQWIIKDWLSTSVQYKYKDKNATDDFYDSSNYSNNVVSGKIKARF